MLMEALFVCGALRLFWLSERICGKHGAEFYEMCA